MISLITPSEYGVLMLGLVGSVIFGVLGGIGVYVWSSHKKRDD